MSDDSMHSVYDMLNFGGTRLKYYKASWKTHVLSKVEMHIWLGVNRELNTKMMLRHKSMDVNQ